MSAKTYDKKTAAFAGFIIQNIPGELSGDLQEVWMNNPYGVKRLLSVLKSVRFASIVGITKLDRAGRKPTRECFTSPRWGRRSYDIDYWLQMEQPQSEACFITAFAPRPPLWPKNFIGAVTTILGVEANVDSSVIGKLLIERGHTITLVQAEELVEATEAFLNETGMQTSKGVNYFFVETGDSKKPVSVGSLTRGVRVSNRWGVDLYTINFISRADLNGDDRLLIRNLEGSQSMQ